MKKIALLVAVLAPLCIPSDAEAFPILFRGRAMMQPQALINFPIPAFPPFFPGGNVSINPGFDFGQFLRGGSTAVDPNVYELLEKRVKEASDAREKLNKEFPLSSGGKTGR